MSTVTYSQSLTQQITHNADFIVEELPEGESFLRSDLRDGWWLSKTLRKLRQRDVVHVEDIVTVDGQGVNVYRVPQHIYDRAVECIEDRDDSVAPLPCGHLGLRNCGDHFQCNYDGCDRQFSREEVAY